MIVGMHQPNYLPWAGYFYKMVKSDVFILTDNCQFVPRSYINRASIKAPDGARWLTVPVRSSARGFQAIKDTEIASPETCFPEHQRTLLLRYGKARFFDLYWPRLCRVYFRGFRSLGDLNIAFIQEIRDLLGIETPLHLGTEFSCAGTQTLRLIELCKAVGADTYLSGRGARKYLDEGLFEDSGIGLVYSDFVHPHYEQRFGSFVEGLSIVDLLMNCGPESRKILETACATVSL